MKKERIFLGRDALMKKAKAKVIEVDLGEDGFTYVKELTAQEKNDYEASLLDKITTPKGDTKYEGCLKNVQAKLAVYVICDEKGKLLFKKEEAASLSNNMLASTMDAIIKAAKKLNKLEEKEKEDKVKN
jgi:hypothetical protein